VTGGQFEVNGTGTTWENQPAGTAPKSNDTLLNTTGGSVVLIHNSGSFAGANGWIIKSEDGSNGGIRVRATSFFSGTNLSITTSNYNAHGADASYESKLILVSSTVEVEGERAWGLYAIFGGTIEGTNLSITTRGDFGWGITAHNANSKVTVVSSTIETRGVDAHGIVVDSGGSVTATDSEFILADPTAALVATVYAGANSVTLTRVTADTIGSGNVLQATDFFGIGNSAVLTLNINDSRLTGNLLTDETTQNTVNLSSSSKLTGKSTQLGDSKLDVNINADSQWVVTAPSTLNDLAVFDQGTLTLELSTAALSDAMLTLNDVFAQGGSTLEIKVDLDILLKGNIFLLADYSSMDFDLGVGVFFNDMNVSSIPVGEEFFWNDVQLVFGNTGHLWTLEVVDIIPEPGTWTLLLGGLGVLGYLQRARRRSN